MSHFSELDIKRRNDEMERKHKIDKEREKFFLKDWRFWVIAAIMVILTLYIALRSQQ